jgi:hypothetical protein
MPFWKKEVEQPPDLAAPPPAPPAGARPMRGSLACSEYGCPRHDGVTCAYVDRRGRLCPTAWCPDHQALVEARPYCRRHARLVTSVMAGEFQMMQALPDLDNRSPSLADYIGDALEPRVLELLWGLCRPGTNDQVASEPLRVVHPIGGGAPRWDRSWKIFDHTGVIVQVTVEVDEGRDPEVDVKVGRHVVGQGVPPWIERHRQALPSLDPAQDAREREAFYAAIWAGAPPRIITEVEQSRELPGYSSR